MTKPTERRNVTQQADWWEAFEREAAKRGWTLSEFLGEGGKLLLTAKATKRLSPRRGRGPERTNRKAKR